MGNFYPAGTLLYKGSLLSKKIPPPLFRTTAFLSLPFFSPLDSEKSIMPFAQLVIGPPGSGKSTYCDGMHQFLSAIGRKCSVVNLDPANDHTSYPCALDIRDLVTLEEIMANEELGPNGGVLYALEELEHNVEWLQSGLDGLGGTCSMLLYAGRDGMCV